MSDEDEDADECSFDELNRCSTHKVEGGRAFLCNTAVEHMSERLDRAGPVKPGETTPTIRCWTCDREFSITLEPRAAHSSREAARHKPAGIENCPFCMSVLIDPIEEK